MHLDYYELTKEPFSITPDPSFLFLSKSHREAIANIIYGIGMKKGFIVITGKIGVGKTMIARACLARADNEYLKTIYIFNTNITFADLLETICLQLGLQVTTDNISHMLNALHLFLLNEHKAERTVALIIDEAQSVPVETLENLRTLSNLETEDKKLIQIVLIGQPKLDKLLNKPELEHIKQRITMRTTVVALTPKESLAYINHRLAKAGAKDTSIFTKTALNRIVKEAKGIPRIINVLCDNSLITSYGHQQKAVTFKTVEETITDLGGQKQHAYLRWQTASLAFAFCLIVMFFVAFRYDYFSLPGIQKQNIADNKAQPLNKQVVPTSINNPAAATQANSQPAPDQKNPQPPPRQAVSKAEPEHTKTMVKMKVKQGDSFIQLTKDFYGRTDKELLSFIKSKNPQIQDVHKLRQGSVVYFPPASEVPQPP
jgi:general secretion pathway protein A